MRRGNLSIAGFFIMILMLSISLFPSSAHADTMSSLAGQAVANVITSPGQTISTVNKAAGTGLGTFMATGNFAQAGIAAFTSLSGGLGSTILTYVSPALNFVIQVVAYYSLVFFSWILWASATFFDYSLAYTINIQNVVSHMTIINVAWNVFRNFINLIFVFLVLYIAIGTILDSPDYNAKKMLSKVIIAAIMINFSLFITKVVVDTSDIMTLLFYNQIVSTTASYGSTAGVANGGTQSVNTGSANTGSVNTGGQISAAVVNSLGLQTMWGIGASKGTTFNASSYNQNGKSVLGTPNILVGFIGAGLFILTTSFVFLLSGILFVYRMIVIIFLMVTSPIGFVGSILPGGKKQSGDWWSRLTSNAVWPVIYMALLYCVMLTVLKSGQAVVPDANKDLFSSIFTGSTFSAAIILNFFVINGLLLGCIMVAQSYKAEGFNRARDLAGKFSYGTAGLVFRNTAGRVANTMANSDSRWFGKNAQNIATRSAFRTLKGIGGRSFDFRNSLKDVKQADVGKGVEGGFAKSVEESTKSKLAFGKTLGGAGQVAYATDLRRTGMFGKVGIGISHAKASDDVMKEGINDTISKYGEQIKEIEEDTDIKKFENLYKRRKAANFSKAETEELKDLMDKFSTEDKYKVDGAKEFNVDKGTFDKIDTDPVKNNGKANMYFNPKGTETLPNGEVIPAGKLLIEEMRKSRTAAQKYVRNKSWNPKKP